MSEATPRIIALHYSPRRRMPMKSVQSILALRDHGLDHDAHARPGGRRQVLFMDVETLRILEVPVGSLKENITTEMLTLSDLKPGDSIIAGEARFEITMECEPCSHLEEVRPGLRNQVAGRRGLLARVTRGGELRVGQPLTVQRIDREVLVHATG